MTAPTKQKYRSTNWTADNAVLKARGSLLTWLEQGMCWHSNASGKRAAVQSKARQRFNSA